MGFHISGPVTGSRVKWGLASNKLDQVEVVVVVEIVEIVVVVVFGQSKGGSGWVSRWVEYYPLYSP